MRIITDINEKKKEKGCKCNIRDEDEGVRAREREGRNENNNKWEGGISQEISSYCYFPLFNFKDGYDINMFFFFFLFTLLCLLFSRQFSG